ncbi:hypothetical protein [Pyruvatibacter sp.]|uniref:hypothetical protein n=1 Tax=Pyruvatibacter sp. TaxID=1981328 RepID=UPI0032ED148D
MTPFVKSWIDAAAAAVSTFAGVAYEPPLAPAAIAPQTDQMMLPFGNVAHRARLHAAPAERKSEPGALAA